MGNRTHLKIPRVYSVVFCGTILYMSYERPLVPDGGKEQKVEKEKILEMLRANGFEHPETKALVMRWTEEQEAAVTADNTSRAAIAFDIERADLYVAIGDIDGALELLDSAREAANCENDESLYDKIMKKMDEIEGLR